MLREAFEQALARGEKMTKELSKELLNSKLVADLANSPRFVNAIAFVIRSKVELTRAVQDRLKGTMELINVPTRQQLRTFERRVARLEKDLDSLSRKYMRARAVKPATKPAVKPAAKAKKAAPKAAAEPVAVAETQKAALKKAASSAESAAPMGNKKTTRSVRNIKPAESAPKTAPAAIAGRPITVH